MKLIQLFIVSNINTNIILRIILFLYLLGLHKNELNENILVKVRSTGKLLSANVNFINENDAEVNLDNSEDGISPGQACVFYNKDQFGHKVLGGGWIKE